MAAMSVMIICFDFETYPIKPGLQVPPAVCMSYARVAPDGNIGSGLVTYGEGIVLLEAWLRSGFHLIGANTAFDILVSVNSAPDPVELMGLWVQALDADRVTDVLLRQKLIDLACDGFLRKGQYGLGGVVKRHSERELDKKNPWRVRFGELDGLPIKDYPEEARMYSLEDAVATAEAWRGQETKRQEGSPHFPERDILCNQYARQRKAMALKDLESWGLRVNKDTAQAYQRQNQVELVKARDALIAGGLVHRKVTKKRGAILALIEEFGLVEHFTVKDKVSLTKKKLETSDHPWLGDLALWPDVQGLDYLVDAGLVEITYHKRTKLAAERMKGCTPNPKLTDTGGVALDADACRQSGDDLLKQYAAYTSLDKTDTNVSKLIAAHPYPVHAHYDPLIATGRTATSNPNEQNQDRKPGIRECRVPPEGMVQIGADYSSVELHAFAEICYQQFGWSNLGDKLNAGVDVHLSVALAWYNMQHPKSPIDYEEAKLRKQSGDPDMKRRRTGGKGVGFGRKGGMGAATFVDYCWANYGLAITQGEAQDLIQLHDAETPEFRLYSNQYIASMGSGYGNPTHIIQPYSGRLRADCGYTDAHNSPFQGLAADLAGEALWLVFKATRGLLELGTDDPLYGCHMCLFVHDEIKLDAPQERGHECAMQLQYLMELAARRVMPHCPPSAEPCIARQLSKLEEQVWLDGRLLPWCLFETARVATDQGPEAVATLKKKGWPEFAFVAR